MDQRFEVSVQLFARAREACGTGVVRLQLAAGAEVGDCLELMRRQYPALAALGGGLLVAVNERYSGSSEPLRDGDVVALIPPVSGG